jgi:hypothetical protein
VLALSIKKNEEKEGKEREGKKKNYLLALSGLEDIQGGCFPD